MPVALWVLGIFSVCHAIQVSPSGPSNPAAQRRHIDQSPRRPGQQVGHAAFVRAGLPGHQQRIEARRIEPGQLRNVARRAANI